MDLNELKPDWISYYLVKSWQWECPICSYTNTTTEHPSGRILRCFKCGSHFDKLINGDNLKG